MVAREPTPGGVALTANEGEGETSHEESGEQTESEQPEQPLSLSDLLG